MLMLLAALGLVLAAPVEQRPTIAPLPNAHAHNDYRHPRPLQDALDHGFCSVEADIFLVDGELLVGHDRADLKPHRNLEALYLAPLRERVKRNDGKVYPGGPGFTLLIDIKTDGEATYPALRALLARYSDILTRFEPGATRPGAVTAILSGTTQPRAAVSGEQMRYAALDGRLPDLSGPLSRHLTPLVSADWNRTFRWRGEGPMPQAEAERLREIVKQAHAAGCRVRFWATADTPALWSELLAAGVDLINTDDLAGLQKFLQQRRR